jgi:phosphatidylserine/phosphatidylglycerophosphate/cardiolipin synthase-like enzyme
VNYELDAVIEDTTLGKAAADMFLADLEQSTEIRLHSGPETGTSTSIRD